MTISLCSPTASRCMCVWCESQQIYIGFICIAAEMAIFMDIYENYDRNFHCLLLCGQTYFLRTQTSTHAKMLAKVVEATTQRLPYIYGVRVRNICERFHFDYFWHYLFDALKVVTLRMLISTAMKILCLFFERAHTDTQTQNGYSIQTDHSLDVGNFPFLFLFLLT